VATLAALGVLLLPRPPAMAAPGEERFDLRQGFSHVAQRVIPAVVFIKVEKEVKGLSGAPFGPNDFFGEEFFERFFGQRVQPRQREQQRRARPFVQTGQGSGFIVSKDGYILTNSHVIDGADKITVRLNNGKEYNARRIGADEPTEVAVIKIEADNLPITCRRSCWATPPSSRSASG
jgi:serine protease Do